MELVSLVEITPGRILARPVANSAGAVLCQAGSLLTEALIEKLENAGIDSVYVQGGGREGPTLEERLAALQTRFTRVADPALLELRAIVEARFDLMRRQNEDTREQRP